MNNIIKVNFDSQMVSARELHEVLSIKTAFKDWFPRMCEYGFLEGTDFCSKMSESTGGRPSKDADISIDMAKHICMIQRTPEGKAIRQYLIDLEKAWNTPEQVMARALKLADRTIVQLKADIEEKDKLLEAQKPKVIFADAVTASDTSILVRELAKILKQNGVNTGEKRLWNWLRENGYILKKSTQPSQRAMEMGLFEILERTVVRGDGPGFVRSTTKVTTKGVQYFINKFLSENEKEAG